jgi:membrane fusion protein, multidrug efflux system
MSQRNFTHGAGQALPPANGDTAPGLAGGSACPTASRRFLRVLCMSALTAVALAQSSNLASVISRPVSRTVELPGEFLPFLSVALHAKVPGYVERIVVDRGSHVQEGEFLAQLTAPELAAQIAEAESKVQAAEAERFQAEAQLAATQSTYDGLKKASQTPGAVAGNELIVAGNQVEAARSLVRARQQASRAAEAGAQAQKDLQAYLRITAPFEGVVTDRLVHPGALAGPATDPLVVIQQVSHLRLVVAVPEEDVGGLVHGAAVSFHVPAFPERTYTASVARIAHALDPKTRTMPVELDVFNRDGSLAPGMYPTVKWPVRSPRPVLLVPKTAVVTTTERTFVIRDRNGRAEWVDVKTGAPEGDLVAVFGDLHAGDMVLRRGSDEVREGAAIR